MSLKVITPPTVEPITIADAKLHARVDVDAEDSMISIWISSGRELAEKFQNRAYITQTLELTLDAWPSSPFALPRPPLQEVKSFKYFDKNNNEYDFTDFITDTDSEPGRIALAYGKDWPSVTLRPINGIKIEYKAGYSDAATAIPQNIRDALLLYVTYRYENREAEFDDAPAQFYHLLWPDRVVPI